MSATDSTRLRVQRTFDASPEDVFDAWTNPEVLRRWWVVDPSWRTSEADVDLRVGGAYRLAMEEPDSGATHVVCGEYREVARPRRLVYSWAWEEDGRVGHVSTVTVEFLQEGEHTTVVLEHSDLPSAESRDRHVHGWEACLGMLGERVLTPVAQSS
jgi:uncharacterized protein YndB with AHSA1/START domain